MGESLVRQWVEFYLSRVRTESQWDALSRERLASALEVTCIPCDALLLNHVHYMEYES